MFWNRFLLDESCEIHLERGSSPFSSHFSPHFRRMDLDPSIYYRSSSPEPTQATPETPSSPLTRITLPTLPRPSVSPASTRVSFTQQQKSGRTSAGLDLSASMQGNYSNGNSNGGGAGGGTSLEDVSRGPIHTGFRYGARWMLSQLE